VTALVTFLISLYNSPNSQVFLEVLQQKHWKRFEYYAPFVRNFSFDEKVMPWSHFPVKWAESLALRSFLALQEGLLPALISLKWKAATTTSLLIGLPHFITGQLDSLSITFLTNDATNALPGVAGFLEPSPPPLTNLEIILCFKADSKSRSFFDTRNDVERIIRKFPNVSRLQTDSWILACGMESPLVLENLREIRVDEYVAWGDTPGFDFDLLSPSKDIFLPRLEYVRTHSLDWGSLFENSEGTVLGFTYSQPEVMRRMWHDHTQLIESFKEIGQLFFNLVTLILQDVRIGQKDADLTGSLLPFLECGALEEFDVLAEAGFVRFISDDDIAQMAAAWPRLKKFIIRYSDLENITSGNTEASDLIPFSFSSIASLVQHCPLLRTLSLSVRSNDLILENSSRYEGVFRLDDLDLGHSLVPSDDGFASLLRDLRPAHRIKWTNEQSLTTLKATLGALQSVTLARRAEESSRQTTELRRRVEQLLEEMGELRGRHDTSNIQNQRLIEALRTENEALRMENEALRSDAGRVQSQEDVKP
jgi:regulator of replication initiation timing